MKWLRKNENLMNDEFGIIFHIELYKTLFFPQNYFVLLSNS